MTKQSILTVGQGVGLAGRIYVSSIFTAAAEFCPFSNKITEALCVVFRTSAKLHESLDLFLDLQFGYHESAFFSVLRYCLQIGTDSLIRNHSKFNLLVFIIP